MFLQIDFKAEIFDLLDTDFDRRATSQRESAIMAWDLYLYLREIETINGSKKRRRDKTDANEYIKLSKIDDTIRYQLIFF
ncbi:hypothetical protein [Campylobacter fetus]|uniref:hypothetical protein n=1 Tax=Campylobacter fetus TaxID=196 RepID=UPI000FCA78A8|nr:hypothetical protein [Campylobacter fetus]QQF52062.1 hypothetical protein HHI31_04160 [Campylobacter fetus subsp. venerealis]RUT51634.1 hypothetical protein BWK67_03735 [Campylobacter fetus]RUT52363.1 hypothetical protein BWK51_03735 [Campylobacter fetus]